MAVKVALFLKSMLKYELGLDNKRRQEDLGLALDVKFNYTGNK